MPVPGECRSCHAEIVWIKTSTGKLIPCDPKSVTVVTTDGKVVMGYTAHFATCPQANAWRVKPPKKEES